MTPTLDWDDKIAFLHLGEDENRFSPDFLDAINDQLDDIEKAGAQGLVTTASGKFYTNGLDLDWLGAHAEQAQPYVARVQALLARVLTFPTPTAAAVTGHAFGAGAMLAMAHDVRVMRADRGFFCFPEVDIRIPFADGMAALIQAKLTPRAAVASMTTGRRFGGKRPPNSASSTRPRPRGRWPRRRPTCCVRWAARTPARSARSSRPCSAPRRGR